MLDSIFKFITDDYDLHMYKNTYNPLDSNLQIIYFAERSNAS